MGTWGSPLWGGGLWGGGTPGVVNPSIPAQTVIYQALRKCGQMRPGYLPQPELLNDCLLEWQMFFDEWNAERTLNYTMPDYVFPVTTQGSGTTGNGQTFGGTGYTIGPTAPDFQTNRPVKIARMNLLLTDASPAMPTRIPIRLISMEEWMQIAVIQMPAVPVTVVAAYDPQWPNAVIWVWPPLNGNSLEIFTWGQLIPPQDYTTDQLSAPPGYWDAVVWTLAERIYGFCTHDIMPQKRDIAWIRGQAYMARDKIRAINAPNPRLISDFDSGPKTAGACDWGLLLTGEPY